MKLHKIRNSFTACDLSRLDTTFALFFLVNVLKLFLITGSEANAVIQQVYQRLPGPTLQSTEAIWYQRTNHCAGV